MSRPPQDSLHTAAFVTPAGADWLASASASPRGVQALWAQSPTAAVTLPCGTAFDVISMDALFGRQVVSRLWSDGPGTGPVAAQGGRVMLFAVPGAAQRLPALLGWEEWGAAAPPLLCYGRGDAVTVPPLFPPDPGPPPPGAAEHAAPESGARESAPAPSPRWLVAPDVRAPWLPGPEVLLWACVRAARATGDNLGGTAVTSAPAMFPG
ncbi:bifunctional DNA primase/polymerase [Streptomyces hygroscopicus]|uniref:bifunctional DNA primase/polymerase n=1 Tax=Streptomyces hygroscopicus TaxID=1912 RepID=UPI0007671105|nr:bifunctional DNA primase/polymerase [Streptomyces hygroscopicus]